MANSIEPSVWLIAGPTASGKSALALRLAQALGGEIVNADSMQLYAGLQVLTARPAAAEEAMVAHHLYGVADPAQAWSVGRWLAAACEALTAIAARERPAVVVGGTGLYFAALTQGLAEVPPTPATVRAAARAEYAQMGEAAFRARLAACDPYAAGRIALGDRQRLLRAYEVVQATGVALHAWQATTRPTLAPGSWRGVVVTPPRAELYARCDARLAAMVQAGGMTEAMVFGARGLDPELPAMKALGVRELIAHGRGELTLEAALALAQQQTRRYAKRQQTWFRNQTPDWPRLAASNTEVLWAELRAMAQL